MTLTLGLVGLGIARTVAIPFGILAALCENTWADCAIGLAALLGEAMPLFRLALLLMLFFGLQLGLVADPGHGLLIASGHAGDRAVLLGDPGADALEPRRYDRRHGTQLHSHRVLRGRHAGRSCASMRYVTQRCGWCRSR